MKNKRRGIALLSLMMGASFLSLVAYTTFALGKRSRQNILLEQERFAAQSLAIELLEGFRAMSAAELQDYLWNNASVTAYPLCSSVNQLDRQSSTESVASYINPNPMVEIEDRNFLWRPENVKLHPNRFYTVSVVNLNDLTLINSECGKTSDYVYDPALKPDERFMVNVVVNWHSKQNAQSRRISLSTLIVE